ncbi:DUF397 domain-containing protein [Micromonospora zhanjiangensis]|uniref:DUF397 domain-containing protein n=1 Tax=Micromonospora zhanjiangensis TaxID=1522057 RepID=A0ABV8KIG5_9ACTN
MFIHSDPRWSTWRKSSRSDGGQNCVQVGQPTDRSHVVPVCDSKAGPTGVVLTFRPDNWARFIAGVKDGQLG